MSESEQLSKLAKVCYGKSPAKVLEEDGLFPIIGTGGRYGLASKALFDGPAIVVPRKGSLGNPQLTLEPFWPVDTTFAVIPEKHVDVRWLYYSLLNFDLTKLNEATGVPSISREWLSRLRFFNPDKEQKRQIGEILRSADEAIEKTESLVAKYQRIRAGLMHDLFTRGVSSDGKLRPPREEVPELYRETSIGWIPKGWDVVLLDHLCNIIDPQPDHRTPPEQDDGIPYIGIGDFDALGDVDTSSCRKVVVAAYLRQKGRFSVEAGDVIYGKIGTIGQPKKLPDSEYALSANVLLMKPSINKRYFFQALMTKNFEKQISDITNTTSQPALGIEKVKKLQLPSPLSAEQVLIAQYLDQLDSKLAKEFSVAQKLKKQKNGLMRDLLTGKVGIVSDATTLEMKSG
jgi:type I restriction enzyme S subunit